MQKARAAQRALDDEVVHRALVVGGLLHAAARHRHLLGLRREHDSCASQRRRLRAAGARRAPHEPVARLLKEPRHDGVARRGHVLRVDDARVGERRVALCEQSHLLVPQRNVRERVGEDGEVRVELQHVKAAREEDGKVVGAQPHQLVPHNGRVAAPAGEFRRVRARHRSRLGARLHVGREQQRHRPADAHERGADAPRGRHSPRVRGDGDEHAPPALVAAAVAHDARDAALGVERDDCLEQRRLARGLHGAREVDHRRLDAAAAEAVDLTLQLGVIARVEPRAVRPVARDGDVLAALALAAVRDARGRRLAPRAHLLRRQRPRAAVAAQAVAGALRLRAVAARVGGEPRVARGVVSVTGVVYAHGRVARTMLHGTSGRV